MCVLPVCKASHSARNVYECPGLPLVSPECVHCPAFVHSLPARQGCVASSSMAVSFPDLSPWDISGQCALSQPQPKPQASPAHLSYSFATEVASVSNNAQGHVFCTPLQIKSSPPSFSCPCYNCRPDGAGREQKEAGLENVNVMHKIISMVIIFHTHLSNFYPLFPEL